MDAETQEGCGTEVHSKAAEPADFAKLHADIVAWHAQASPPSPMLTPSSSLVHPPRACPFQDGRGKISFGPPCDREIQCSQVHMALSKARFSALWYKSGS